MAMPRLVGLFMVLIGVLSGAILVAQPFVAALTANPLVMALLLPACLVVGLPLYASGPQKGIALRVAGGALVGLGLLSLLGLFVDGAGLVSAQRPTMALWLVAPVALVLGLLLNHAAGAFARAEGS